MALKSTDTRYTTRLRYSPGLYRKVLVLPFSLPGFVIDAVYTIDGKLLVEAIAVRFTVACPDCHQLSARIHSWYMRTPRDLPVSDQFVQLHLHVRRFFCDTPSCARRTFAERLPELVPFRAQRTQRFSRSLEVLGFALAGRAAARVAATLCFRTSRNTLLRVVQRAELPAHPTPRVLGVDDVAFRKGHTYGTILVDLEQHRPVDLLPDRDAALLASWLKAHPGVEIVSRDRSTEFRRGITSGAPDAIQVADRFHLMVRRITHPSIPISDGKGSEECLWVNGLPHGESLRGKRACR